MTTYSDYELNRGPGMFPTEQALFGGHEAYNNAVKFMEGDIENDEMNLDETELINVFTAIASEFYNNLDFDQRATYSQIAQQIEALQGQVSGLLRVLEDVQPHVRRALSYKASHYQTGIHQSPKDVVKEAISANSALKQAIDEIRTNSNERQPRIAVKKACAKIMAIRHRLVGRDLKSDITRVLAPKKDKDLGFAEEFRNRDAQFVYVVLRSFDHGVSIKTIGSSFDEHVSKMRGR